MKDCPEAATFVTEEPMGEAVWIEADASTGGRNMDDQVIWTMVDNPDDDINSGDPIPTTNPQEGTSVMTYSFSSSTVPPVAVNGRTKPLSYQIIASIVSGRKFNDKIIITQDELDQLRQEYIDISKRTDNRRYKGPLPASGVFTNSVRSEFKSSDYDYWIVNWYINLPEKFDALEAAYGSDIGLTSGYRNPAKQLKMRNNTGNANSFHVYGQAIDYNQQDDEDNWDVWSAARNTNPAENILYDQHDHRIYNSGEQGCQIDPQWPLPYFGSVYSGGVVVHNHLINAYTHGHVGWQ